MLTAKDQLMWTQRIGKEEGVNTKVNPDGFSVLGAIRVQDVPKRFKPGHSDPTKVEADEGFPHGSELRKELEFRLREREAPRRDRYLWPETSQQEHGWFQKDPAKGPEKKGRGTMTGALPMAHCRGIGWRDKRYEDKVYKKLAPEEGGYLVPPGGLTSLKTEKEYKEKPPVPRPTVRESFSENPRAPWAFTSREAIEKVIAKSASTGGIVRGASHCNADRRADGSLGLIGTATDPTALAQTAPSGTKVLAACKSISEGNLGVMSRGSTVKNADDHICTESFEAAMARGRIFANRHPHYKWYVPLSNSDVNKYVDNFTKCFGKPYFAKGTKIR